MSKNKWKTVDLTLKFSTASDWSLEEPDAPLSDVKSIRSSLPTKTNATRQTAELDNISENGPFILNFANISFEATEDELKQFFRAFTVIGIELNSPRRGCGHIEFTNINDLAGAWKMNDKMFLSRPIRLSIPLKEDMARQQTTGNKQRYQTQQKSSTFDGDESENWRTKKPQAIAEKESATPNKDGEKQWRTKTTKDAEDPPQPSPSDASDWRSDRRGKTTNEPEKKTDITQNVRNAWKTGSNKDVGKRFNQNDVKTTENVDDKSNWRGRGVRDVEVRGDNQNDSDVWRKPRSNDIASPSSKEHEKRDSFRSDNSGSVVNEELSGLKKKDIFGEAKPINTTQRDLEIEMKLEQAKLTVTEQPKQEPTFKSNVIGAKKTSNISDIDNLENWRIKPATNPPDVKEVVVIPEPSPKKPQPAPPPPVNYWETRKKIKVIAISSTTEHPTIDTTKDTVIETKSVEKILETKTTVEVEETKPSERIDAVIKSAAVINSVDEQSESDAVSCQSVDNRVTAKPQAVISINGPYIDAKSLRTPLHSVCETKAPTAVPFAKVVLPTTTIVKTDVDSCPQSTTKTSNKTFASITAASSWSNGPPKSLLVDKQAITVVPSHPGN